ncbi:MAG: hypothetical protein ACHQNA_00050 [Acidimicrobiales bacterium]
MPTTLAAGRERAAARRRLRRRRLARTMVVGVAVVVLLVVLVTRGSGRKKPAASPAPTTAAGQAAGTVLAPATTASPPQQVHVAAAPAGLPAARSRPAVVAEQGSLLILGGLVGGTPGTSTATVLRFDPGAATVTPAGTLAVATHDAAATSAPAGTLVFGGGEATTIDTVQAYTAGGTHVVGHLPRPRSDVVAANVDGHAYVLAGFDGTTGQADVLRTDDGVTFTVVARLPVPVRYPGIVTVGSVIYLLGGVVGGRSVDDIQAVDVAAGSARVVAHLPTPVSDAMAFTLRGSVFLAGGLTGGTPRAAIERVDLATGTETPAGALPAPVADAGVGQVGDTAYLIGGEGPGRLSSILAVSPS